MEDLENKIEDAAKQYANGSRNPSEYMKAEESAWENGALSNEAKAFHQQGMYSEKEIRELISKLCRDCYYMQEENQDINMWFNQNKKK